MVNGTGTADNHAVGSVVGGEVVDDILASDGHDVLDRAEDGASERTATEGSLVEAIEDDLAK